MSGITPNIDSISWKAIEDSLSSMVPISEGFSSATKGIVTVPGGSQVFVKLAANDKSKAEVRKEILVYDLLKSHGYPYIPALLACHPEKTGLALEALLPEAGWDWSASWTEPRLTLALEAMDVLAAMSVSGVTDELQVRALTDANSGWKALTGSPEKQLAVRQDLSKEGYPHIAETLDFQALASQDNFPLTNTAPVHYDVRSYNCAYREGEVRLVDYDWFDPAGSPQVAQAFTVMDAQSSGLDITKKHAARLDPAALIWVAGYWLNGAVRASISEKNRRLKIHRAAAALALFQDSQAGLRRN